MDDLIYFQGQDQGILQVTFLLMYNTVLLVSYIVLKLDADL